MTAEPFTTAGENLTCQGCGGTIRVNTSMYFVHGSFDEGDDSWACSPECGRAAEIRRAIEGLADRLEKSIDDLRVVIARGVPAP